MRRGKRRGQTVVMAVVLAAAVTSPARAGSIEDAFLAVQAARAAAAPASVGAPAAAGKGIATTADSVKIMVNKDLGTERWAITWDEGGTRLTGNVFSPTGVSFLDCHVYSITGRDLNTDSLYMNCEGASGIVQPENWRRVASGVKLRLTFFIP